MRHCSSYRHVNPNLPKNYILIPICMNMIVLKISGGGQQKNMILTENCGFENTGILLCSVTMGLGTSSNIYFVLSPKMLKEVQN